MSYRIHVQPCSKPLEVKDASATSAAEALPHRLILLQSFTLVWMLAECGASLWAAAQAHSPALVAFGLDSLIELLSALLVLCATGLRLSRRSIDGQTIDRRTIDRSAGILLFALAAAVALISVLALAGKLEPHPSPLGIFITAAALCVMPLLAWQKRKLARRTGNNALAADAVQSATCAYLSLVALLGLALNAAFGLSEADSLAGLAAVPFLLQEGRRALRGESCGCP